MNTSTTISRAHVWRQASGGGLPVDFLNWLAAMWEQFDAEMREELYGFHVYFSIEDRRAHFDDWLLGRMNA